MKRLLAFAVAAVFGLSTVTVFAGGGGCCAAGASKSAACADTFSKLNLTDAQKAQVATLKDSLKRATSTSESRAMFDDGLAKILTPEQFAQMKGQCDKAKASGDCPYMKSQSKL